MSERYRGTVRAPEFPPDLEWLNVAAPLRMGDLRGKLILLDFWSYCCINCRHVLPELRKLEERFPNELVVIGVHSGKFSAEGDTFNLRQAVVRLDIRHPVINDRDFILWRAYAVRAWPTLVPVDPAGNVVGVSSGEFSADRFGDGLEAILAKMRATGKLAPQPAPVVMRLERKKLPDTLLSFPGKVLADPEEDRLFIADTEHHRVLQFGLTDRKLRAVYGRGEPGLTDGGGSHARFRSPHGLALRGNALFVADTGNHVIRRVALDTGVVRLLAGTGEQARPRPNEGVGREQALNSPWDLAVWNEVLYIAMAGSHQIWALDLHAGQLATFAGDGVEALRDAPLRKAQLAQPSGLAIDGTHLWWVDSESSSLRSAKLTGEGEALTHIGLGLFDFGNVDGDYKTARLQHPLGITCRAGKVYIADSYNNNVRIFDPRTGLLTTLAGSGEPGLEDGDAGHACFWEPGGISATQDRIYVADTNNHAVRVVDPRTGEVMTVDLRAG